MCRLADIVVVCSMLAASATAAVQEAKCFEPGKDWLDSEANLIDAHGGGILKVGQIYYWYGENYRLGKGNTTGVSCYSSTDLYNWKNEGMALSKKDLPPEYRAGNGERPKVIYNAKTDKYVMWMHLDYNGYTAARAGVAASNKPTEPFEFVRDFRPIKYDFGPPDVDRLEQKELGSTYRDMTLFVDDDEQAYVFYAGEDNKTMYVSQLSDDFTDVKRPDVKGQTWERILINEGREAPAPFKYNGKYYMFTSGLTGWVPNPAQYHVADRILGPWKTIGNPCYGPDSDKTFFSQSTYVLPAPGKPPGNFIFMADRWVGNDLVKSRYVWLPFCVGENDRIILDNYDRWNLNIFEQEVGIPASPKTTFSKHKGGPHLKWDKVKGADGYRIFKNGRYEGFTTSQQFPLRQELVGRSYSYGVVAITLEGGSSAMRSTTFDWDKPADVFLSDVEPDFCTQGFGFLRKDSAIEGGLIRIVNQPFAKGLGTHSPSEIVYYLSGRYKRFRSWVGVDAFASFQNASSIEFKVYGDRILLFESGIMRVSTPAKSVDVDVSGINELKLVVTDAGDGTHYDHADWADAKLHAR